MKRKKTAKKHAQTQSSKLCLRRDHYMLTDDQFSTVINALNHAATFWENECKEHHSEFLTLAKEQAKSYRAVLASLER